MQSKYFPNLSASSNKGFYHASLHHKASPCKLQPHPYTLCLARAFLPAKQSLWTGISSVEKLLHDPVCDFREGHNVSKVKFRYAPPWAQDTRLLQHAIQYLQWVQRSQNQKFYPSCPHDESLATRLEIWLNEKVGVSQCCETICKHKLTSCCLTLPYNLNTLTQH